MGTPFAYGNKLIQQQIKQLNGAKNIVVIGSGTMGIGIGIDLLNKTQLNVHFIDISEQSLKRAQQEISTYYTDLEKNDRILTEHKEDFLSRLIFTQDYSILSEADIIWEAATEKIEVKKSIFDQIEEHANPDRVILIFSNTSSHTTEELAILLKDSFFKEKFLTGHGYFPFHTNRLFDVMKSKYATEESYQLGIVFAEQMLEKKVIALRKDHHGYIADPIFEGMAAIASWDIQSGQDIVELGNVFSLVTANPFEVLDRTGHMPYTECAKHLGTALPDHDRLKPVYNQQNRHYPEWIEDLEKAGSIGVSSDKKQGFYKWEGKPNREKPVKVYDPKSKTYVAIQDVNIKEFWSFSEAKAYDHRESTIKHPEGLILIAKSDDKGGKTFRRYMIPIMLYCLDLIQDGYCTPGDINTSTKVGLRYKYGIIEIIDAFINHFGIDGLLNLARKSAIENIDRTEMFDVDGKSVSRINRPSFLYDMKANGWKTLLGYGRIYNTPVSQLNHEIGDYDIYYNDLKYIEPTKRDRVASIIFDNPLRGNVWNKYTLDQLDHAMGVSIQKYEKGELGSILFTASGSGMRMLGADARQFNKGWFEPEKGYQFLGEEEAAYFTKAGMKLFRFIQECPIWTIGVFGEKWGGGAEFSYFLNQRFDVLLKGIEFNTVTRKNEYTTKKNYNQPEIEYAILGGFGAVQELRRLGLGDSLIDELFLQGMTAERAYQVGLSNGINESEYELLEQAFEIARLRQKYAAPYSTALYNLHKKRVFFEGCNDQLLIKETGETFNPDKNPYVATGLLRLLNRNGANPKLDLTVQGSLPGWKNNYEPLYS